MSNVKSAISQYNALYFANKRAEKLEEKLNKSVEKLSPEEMAEYVRETTKQDASRNRE